LSFVIPSQKQCTHPHLLSRSAASLATSPPRAPATSPWAGHLEHPPAKLALHHDPLSPPVPRHPFTIAEPGPRRRTAAGPHRRSSPAGSPLPVARTTSSAPLLWHVGPRHGAVPAPFPLLAGRVGRLPTRPCARPRSLGQKSPPAQLAQNSFFFFLFLFLFPFSISFSYFHIYIHILIFYAPKIV
jgi:hypothetical protein